MSVMDDEAGICKFGGTITQNQALEIAQQTFVGEWTVQHAESQEAYSTSMESLTAGTADTPVKLVAAMLAAYNAASFGSCDGHFESAYREPDNSWLGVEEFVDGEVVEAIRKKAAGAVAPCMVMDLAASSSKV
jgi:hypothetical protein